MFHQSIWYVYIPPSQPERICLPFPSTSTRVRLNYLPSLPSRHLVSPGNGKPPWWVRLSCTSSADLWVPFHLQKHLSICYLCSTAFTYRYDIALQFEPLVSRGFSNQAFWTQWQIVLVVHCRPLWQDTRDYCIYTIRSTLLSKGKIKKKKKPFKAPCPLWYLNQILNCYNHTSNLYL